MAYKKFHKNIKISHGSNVYLSCFSATSLHHSQHNPRKTRDIAKGEGVVVAPPPIVFKTIAVKIANRVCSRKDPYLLHRVNFCCLFSTPPCLGFRQ